MSGDPGPLSIAVTGGIGSGKSTAAAVLADLGALVVDSDRLAREVVAPGTPGLAAVAAEFGPSVVTVDGALDRAALADIVFIMSSSAVDTAARRGDARSFARRGERVVRVMCSGGSSSHVQGWRGA